MSNLRAETIDDVAGFDRSDFLVEADRRDEPYKRRWGGEERHEVQFAAYRRYRAGVKRKMRRTDPS